MGVCTTAGAGEVKRFTLLLVMTLLLVGCEQGEQALRALLGRERPSPGVLKDIREGCRISASFEPDPDARNAHYNRCVDASVDAWRKEHREATPDPHRLWRGIAYRTDLPWEPAKLYPSKVACEDARHELLDWEKSTYSTVCVPVGLTPKDIGRK